MTANLSLTEKCAQMIIADYRFADQNYDRGVLLSKAGVGGFCIFGGEISDFSETLNALQRHAKVPLLFAADYEDGAGTQVPKTTRLPSNLAVGATGSVDFAKQKGLVTALEASTIGIRWILAPVLDLNTERDNPIINVRSFGKDPTAVANLGRAYLAGLHEHGAIGCGKHFPGHGSVKVDSHLELPTVETSKEDLRAGEVKVYEDLSKDLDAVMTGHLLAPALDGERPASLSKAATGEFLRKELGYEGLVCTDAFNMGAITNTVSEGEAVVQAAQAGADCILLPKDALHAIDALEQAVKSGKLAEDVVTRAADRILAVKEKLGLNQNRKVDEYAPDRTMNVDEHRDLAQKIAEASITQVKGNCVAQPECFYVQVSDTNNCPGDTGVFEKHLQTRIGRMVIGVFWKQKAFDGGTRLPEHLIKRIDTSLKQEPEAIVVSFGDPYILHQINEEVKHYACAWSVSEASQRAAAWAVQGKIPFQGGMPVDLGL